ncbi:unnamed protein product [Gongylonema pulchrum]|uniref:Uncharacterized protein n=1 Tax=Gongylonema pulchrum TaxID=637853 RepID=A0A183DJA8_9BILA|nr:unnamed protein product [Gongylonema pulchrum]
MQILGTAYLLFIFFPVLVVNDDFLEAEVLLGGKKDTDGVLGAFVNDFFADSQWQLIVDLDLLKSLFIRPSSKFEKALKTGDESYIQHLLSLLEPLKVSIVSSVRFGSIKLL